MKFQHILGLTTSTKMWTHLQSFPSLDSRPLAGEEMPEQLLKHPHAPWAVVIEKCGTGSRVNSAAAVSHSPTGVLSCTVRGGVLMRGVWGWCACGCKRLWLLPFPPGARCSILAALLILGSCISKKARELAASLSFWHADIIICMLLTARWRQAAALQRHTTVMLQAGIAGHMSFSGKDMDKVYPEPHQSCGHM